MFGRTKQVNREADRRITPEFSSSVQPSVVCRQWTANNKVRYTVVCSRMLHSPPDHHSLTKHAMLHQSHVECEVNILTIRKECRLMGITHHVSVLPSSLAPYTMMHECIFSELYHQFYMKF